MLATVKKTFPTAVAERIARDIVTILEPACERIEIAGSLRRRKPNVGDIEIIYVSKTKVMYDLLGETDKEVPIVDLLIAELISSRRLERRKNIKGNETFGQHIKLLRNTQTGIPIDLFSCAAESWFNYLVCRTGGAASNTRIAGLAKSRGYKWEPYTSGFVDLSDGRRISMQSEQDVFKLVGLPYEEPWQRP